MTHYIVHFEHDARRHWGVLSKEHITTLPGDFASTGDLVRACGALDLGAVDGPRVPLDTVRLLSPVTRDQQFVCQGANYRQHMIESGVDPDEKSFNMIFTKAPSCIVPADSDVVIPDGVRFLDYEIELGLVLRQDIRGPVEVHDGNLHEFVAAVVIVNDYSARDVQIPQMQFFKGKSFRTFGPVGPRLAMIDEHNVHLLGDLQLTLSVNGEVRQDDSTRNLVFGPAETLTELSRVHDFSAGDLLATGTPSGCALSIPSPMKRKVSGLLPDGMRWELFFKIQESRPQYLGVGDVVEARICSPDGLLDLGVQTNRITKGVA